MKIIKSVENQLVCPEATQDISLNLKNRKICVEKANYGPANPQLDDEEFWIKKAKLFNTSVDKIKMSYDEFIKKLYQMAKRKGPEFVSAIPQATKDKLGLTT